MADRARVTRAAGAVRRRWGRRGGRTGALSVVVAVEPAGEATLPETLGSLAALQPTPQVVVSRAADWLTAADDGLARATGATVLVVRAGDLVRPRAVAGALAALGSGAVLWAPTQHRGRPDPWRAHAADAEPVTDLSPSTLLARRRAWSGHTLAGTHPQLSTAVLDLLLAHDPVRWTDPLVEQRPGHGRAPYAAHHPLLDELDELGAALGAVGLRCSGSRWAAAWQRQLADVWAPRLLDEAESATDRQWAALRTIAGTADPAHAQALPRALLRLAAEDRRADLETVADTAWRDGHDLRTETDGADVLAVWPVPLPRETRLLHPDETPLVVRVHRRDQTRVDLMLWVPHLDLAARDVAVRVHDVLVPAVEDPAATRVAGHRFAAALALSLPVSHGETRLPLRLSAGGVVRETFVVAPAADPVAAAAAVDAIGLDGEELVVRHAGSGAGLRLVADDEGEWTAPVLGGGEARWSLQHTRWGRRTLRPTGHHRLFKADAPAATWPGVLPLDELGATHRLTGWRGPHGGLVLRLGPALDDAELGPRAQRRLQAAYLDDTREIDTGLWLFESYLGRSATDSPRAIAEELLRRDTGVRVLWSVADAGQEVPPGVTPVLRHSAAWYDALAGAGTLVVNTDMDEWFRRRPGQRLLQCFHGYPSKAMGRDQWAALRLPPREVRMLRHRGVDTWSAILTPTPEMTAHYREQYDYHGPAFEQGYPRDDALVAPDPAARAAARAALGLTDQVAVLYAPTWREHLATRPRAAELADDLDAAALVEELGPDHVLLLRGHRFHRPDAPHPRVLDVTDHPEVNELVLASDAAVLDYSSLRFDYALTGKPMVFLVPDLAEYSAGSRAFLMPFEETAPGPQVTDTAGVARALRDLPRLAEQWAAARAAFVAAYQPGQDGLAAARVVDGLLAGVGWVDL